MNRDWISVKGDESKTQGIIRLFNDIFKMNADAQYLDWKNRKNPAGESIVELAINEENVIGHVCLMKYKIRMFKESVFAGQSVDAMVDPDFRRMGIFEGLAKNAYETGLAEGMKLIFRFPNQLALSAAISKQNTKMICNIPQYLKIISPYEATSLFTSNNIVRAVGTVAFSLLNAIKGFTWRKHDDYHIKDISSFTEEFDELWNEVKDEYNIAIERTADYLNWRYIKSPNRYLTKAVFKDGALLGYIVATIEHKTAKNGLTVKLCHIADVLCKSSESPSLQLLLKEVEDYAKGQGACGISCWMLKQWFYSNALTSNGYFHFRSPSVLAGVIISHTFANIEDKVFDANNWFVTIGDSDYV